MTFNQKLVDKLNWLESEGFNLYFDEFAQTWEIMSKDEDYSLTCPNKEHAIIMAFGDLTNLKY